MAEEIRSPKYLFSVAEAAGLLSMGVRTLWEQIKFGKIQTRRVGRRVYVSRQALEKFARGK